MQFFESNWRGQARWHCSYITPKSLSKISYLYSSIRFVLCECALSSINNCWKGWENSTPLSKTLNIHWTTKYLVLPFIFMYVPDQSIVPPNEKTYFGHSHPNYWDSVIWWINNRVVWTTFWLLEQNKNNRVMIFILWFIHTHTQIYIWYVCVFVEVSKGLMKNKFANTSCIHFASDSLVTEICMNLI